MDKLDRDLMIRTIIGEAAQEPDAGQAAVAHVIFNRLKAGDWGKTPAEVVLAKGQFEPWQTRAGELLNIDPRSPLYTKIGKMVDAVASGTNEDPTGGATYFLQPEIVRKRRGGSLPAWASGHGMKIGNHTFYYGNRDGTQQMASNKTATSTGDAVTDKDIEATAKALGLKFNRADPTAQPEPAAAASPVSVKPEDIQETLRALGLKESAPEKPAVAAPAVPEPPPVPDRAPVRITVGGPKYQSGYTDQLVQGMPVVGPAFNKASAAAGAGLDILADTIKGRDDDTPFGERYDNRLAAILSDKHKFAAEHPIGSTVSNLIGGGMLLGPLSRAPYIGALLGASGPSLGTRVITGLTGGSGIGATDAAMRGEDVKAGALYGGAGGAAGAMIGDAVRGGTNWIIRNLLPRPGALKGMSTTAINRLTNALEGETPASLAAAKARMGPAGFVGDINPAMTDLAGGIADIPGPGKAVVRGAYANRAAQHRQRLEAALDTNIHPYTNIEDLKQFLTETRKAAADPLYKAWRTMEVHPTDKIKELIPRLDAAGAFNLAEESAAVRGKPLDKSFFTSGSNKRFPTTESWDLVKRGLDRKIDQAYRAGDKKHAADLIELKHDMVREIEKTDAGKVWRQAREEFAERSALIEQIEAGRDTFLGGRSGISVDELRNELRSLSGPELQARIIGMRSAIDDAMGNAINGDTTMRNKLLAPNNIKKMGLMVGPVRAKQLVQMMEQERYLAAQHHNVSGNSQTTPKKERVNALLPTVPKWDPDLSRPFTYLPPKLVHEFKPSTIVDAWRQQRSGNDLARLAPLLTTPSATPEFSALLRALRREGNRRDRLGEAATSGGSALSALIAGGVPTSVRQSSAAP